MKYGLLFVFILVIVPVILFSQTSTPPAGTGTAGDPYQITSLDNLYWLTQTTSAWAAGKYFLQKNDIDASGTSGWASGAGFSPIGNSPYFYGNYDGGGYTISGLTINRTSDYSVGMFSRVYTGGVVKNLKLTNVSITGGTLAGGLVGYLYGGSIDKCSTTGTVSADFATGGMAGVTETNAAAISESYSSCNVVARGTSSHFIGGFVGEHRGTATNCYASGNVTVVSGQTYSGGGGFTGSSYAVFGPGTIINCYASGTITGTGTKGGLVGTISGGVYTNCFYDSDRLPNSGPGTGKTTAQMKIQSTFTDASWDFTTIWEIVSGYYPRLRSVLDPTLPVELATFIASINNSVVALRWKTATEVNNYGFEIERRAVNGEQQTVNSWQKIGFVQGAGTSNSPKEYSYSDATASSGSYVYRLKQVDNDGTFKYSQSVEVSFMTPAEFVLDQNYPNPFNPSTVISYQLPVTGNVTLKIYNVLGKEVATLVNETKNAGSYTAEFNASQLSSGIYFFKLTTNQFSSVRKMLMIK